MATAKKKIARKSTTRRKTSTATRAKRPAAKKAPKAPVAGEEIRGAARKAAEFLGMNPDEVEATADKLRGQTSQASKRIRAEMGKLSERADELTARFDEGLKQGVQKAEQLADEVARGLGLEKGELSHKVNAGMDRLTKEATRLAEEAETEAKKMFDQARQRLNDILSKRGK